MKKALASREQKRKEGEEARRSADLGSGGGLKKGFFSTAKAKKRDPVEKAEEVPYIVGAGSVEEARRQSLQMPEVQEAVKQNISRLQEDQSWVTPQLLSAMQARPDLMQALSKPKIKEAMQLMQTNPEEAKRRYNHDEEVMKFMKDFSSLMATHFDVLSKEAPDPKKSNSTSSSTEVVATKVPPGAPVISRGGAGYASSNEATPLSNPEVAAAFQDAEVQQLIAELRAGAPLEMHELGQTRPHLMHKVKILLDSGLLALAR